MQTLAPNKTNPGVGLAQKTPFFYGWVVLAFGTLAVVFSIPGQTMGVSVFTDSLLEATGLSGQPFFGALYGACDPLIGSVCKRQCRPAQYGSRQIARAFRGVAPAAVTVGIVDEPVESLSDQLSIGTSINLR